MIVEPRLVEYLNSLETELPMHLAKLEAYALEHEVPIIRKEAQSLLKFFLELKQPKKILEVGTAIGFSASLLCEYMPADCHLTTIEKVPMRIAEAQKNLAALKRSRDVTFLTGDAEEVLRTLREQGHQYDFVFMDAAKAQYYVGTWDAVSYIVDGETYPAELVGPTTLILNADGTAQMIEGDEEAYELYSQYYPDLQLPETVDGKAFFGAYVVAKAGAVQTGETGQKEGKKQTVDWDSLPTDSVWAYYVDNSGGFLLHVGGETFDRAGHPGGYESNLRRGYAHRGENGKFSSVCYLYRLREAEQPINGIHWEPVFGYCDTEEDMMRVRSEVKDTLEHLTVWYADHRE